MPVFGDLIGVVKWSQVDDVTFLMIVNGFRQRDGEDTNEEDEDLHTCNFIYINLPFLELFKFTIMHTLAQKIHIKNMYITMRIKKETSCISNNPPDPARP